MILCNIGNTNANFLDNGRFFTKNIEAFLKMDIQEKVFYINVNERLKDFLQSKKNFINLQEYFTLDTQYQGLGIDRMAACCGYSNGVIVDAGSAITIDIMLDNKHLGGAILPGLAKYKKAYIDISSRLNYELNTAIDLNSYPLCTKDALSYGTLKSVILCIEAMAKDKNIIFTGGDGAFLSGFFEKSIFDKLLIHRSMEKIIKKHKLL